MKTRITAARWKEIVRRGPGRWLAWSADLLCRVARLVVRRETPRMQFQEPGTSLEARLQLPSQSFLASWIARLNFNFRWFFLSRGSSGGFELVGAGPAPGKEDGPADSTFHPIAFPLVGRTPERLQGSAAKPWTRWIPPPMCSFAAKTPARPSFTVPERLFLAAPVVSDETARLGRAVLERTARVERPAQGQVRMRHRIDFQSAASAVLQERSGPRDARRFRERLGPPAIADTAHEAKLNVDQLTEEVIRRIDDRMRAHRERMGRVF
jgi:hypothetical protein